MIYLFDPFCADIVIFLTVSTATVWQLETVSGSAAAELSPQNAVR